LQRNVIGPAVTIRAVAANSDHRIRDGQDARRRMDLLAGAAAGIAAAVPAFVMLDNDSGYVVGSAPL